MGSRWDNSWVGQGRGSMHCRRESGLARQDGGRLQAHDPQRRPSNLSPITTLSLLAPYSGLNSWARPALHQRPPKSLLA
jgi:hypothetical protein